MLQSDLVLDILKTCTRRWMDNELTEIPKVGSTTIEELIEGLHGCNFYSWKADDRSRGDLNPVIIVQYKRNLDASNLMRNHFMEAIDSLTVKSLRLEPKQEYSNLKLNSETVGQMLDRMSVLTLKGAFVSMRLDQSSTIEAHERIGKQLAYVTRCYDQFLQNLKDGKSYMLAYRQYKMYKPDV